MNKRDLLNYEGCIFIMISGCDMFGGFVEVDDDDDDDDDDGEP